MPVVLLALTAILVAFGIFAPGQLGATTGIAAGTALPGVLPSAGTPEQAVNNLLIELRKHNWAAAHEQIANSAALDQSLLVRDFAGSFGSLRSYSSLQNWDLHPLHATSDDAQVRVSLHWATAVGGLDEVRDLKVLHQGNTWRVEWPVPQFPNIPAQIIPVNYLRWDLVSGSADDEWGERNVDSPHVRIISMNAVDYADGSIVMGEVVNEDTIPAFVNVNAALMDASGNPIDEESSFDKIAHVLLPKQVSPYRIDFPRISLQNVKNVRMDVKATLVPGSADPVISVMDQQVAGDAQGHKVLQGKLVNQSGQVVNIPHVIATFYDGSGHVVWVSDGYVDRVLFPQTPEAFTVEIPGSISAKVQSYHVVVNQYSMGKS